MLLGFLEATSAYNALDCAAEAPVLSPELENRKGRGKEVDAYMRVLEVP